MLTGGAEALAAFIHAGEPLAGLEAEGALTVAGDRALAERLPGLFPMPDPAPKPEP